MSKVKVGDVVQNKICPGLIGTVISLDEETGSGMVRVRGEGLTTVFDYWIVIKENRVVEKWEAL